jgi:hypothetical protein
MPGVCPLFGLVVSQGPPVVETENESGPLKEVIFRLCEPEEVRPPYVNVNDVGLAVSMPAVAVAFTVRLTVVV